MYPLSFSSRVSGASISLEEWTRIFPTKVKAKHCPLHAVCIKSDSEFLVKGVIEWLPKRKGNGWKDSKGKPVANRKIWEQIGDTLIKIESNVNVQFWLVEEAMNAPMQDCLPTHVSAKKTVQRVRVLSDRQ